SDALTYMRTSAYLSVSLLFFAALVWRQPEPMTKAILAGLIVASVIAAAIGVAAYFNLLPDSEAFAVYGRATGGFKDPNVFGPSLVFPTLYVAQRLAFRRFRENWWCAPILALLVLALFLSFSRGAWVNFTFSAIVFFSMSYVTAPAAERGRVLRLVIILIGLS